MLSGGEGGKISGATVSNRVGFLLSLQFRQEELVQQMIDDIVDQIFNATVANW